ncbi:MAG: M14 family zinc carboxypeptidase, partial [Bacteroidota bacterium]
DNSGSSPNENSQVYRGTAPFSEPETQAVRDFCNQHQFVVALNYHSYGNLLIYPWGYSDLPTEDAATFNALADAMTLENNYFAGTGTETVGYTVNGDADDWMYGESNSKPKIYAMTPEVGPSSDRFWPASSKIEQLCKDAMLTNLATARAVHAYPSVVQQGSTVVTDVANEFAFELSNQGLVDGVFSVEIQPLSDNIIEVSGPQQYPIAALERTFGQFQYRLQEDMENGEEIRLLVRLSNGDFVQEQVMTQTFFRAEVAFKDAMKDISEWTGDWATTKARFVSAPSCITDSPDGTYGFNTIILTRLKEAINLEGVTNVRLRYHAQWDLGEGDRVQVAIRIGNSAYLPLCTKHVDPFLENAYGGKQPSWIYEDIDLTPFLDIYDDDLYASELSVQFSLLADGYDEGDGFYLDDLEILVVREGSVQTIPVPAEDWSSTATPNPAQETLTILLEQFTPDSFVRIYNALGQEVHKTTIQDETTTVDIGTWKKGIYFYQVEQQGRLLAAKRILVQ